MAKFLFIYRHCRDAAALPPQQREEQIQRWRSWLLGGSERGWLVEAGDALKKDRRVVQGQAVSDGPFAESKEVIGGFSIVQAETLEAAAELAKGCPVLLVGGSVEVAAFEGITQKLRSTGLNL